ncbi:polysaccharide deacetylase family protein [Desulfosporosinus sp. BICA1-9]|uniref:polysaccharide deacetylase family protein n=1 Tax=Desulfosporosinus sp. BICA1-9 TaxID=1531958 RepID=UPI00054B081B|nr:polysaccharide deacetylase family protein [Desulfosporosinus sp. BICA1-9]KJS47320.1 MAG: polysaccharide deacetylase [Peptococcaceae bacterium BRH_c23]KJS86553.1 MAG: polysaccharide deacetylase [Desulfosporosinus sp. BICA1-9]HBW36932.1 polysaccharide deacetylase [Desulfosporosinus sp.]
MFINLKISRRILSLVGIFFLLVVGITERWFIGSNASVTKPIEQVNTDQLIMALTINVDWGEEYIPAILDELDKGKARVTFFVTGRWAKKNPETLKMISNRGHQIENHGYSHPHPDRLSVSANQEEIKKTETIIEEIIGQKTHLYAPPYGEKGASGLRAAKELGYQTILWTLDTVDWRTDSTPEIIAKRIINPAIRFGIKPNKSGAIVLMHPKANTVKALPVILHQLALQGYSFQSLDELITYHQSGDTTS